MTTNASANEMHWLAVKDRLAKKWHLGATELANKTACGVALYHPDHYRPPTGEAGWQAEADLARVDCGSCKRQARYKTAIAGQYPTTAGAPSTTTRRRNARRGTSTHEGDSGRQAPEQGTRHGAHPNNANARIEGDEAARLLAEAAERQAAVNDRPSNGGGDPAVQPKPKRKSRAQRAAELADRDRAAAASQAADATVNAIDAALAGAETVNIDAVAAQAAADQAAGECQADEQ